MTLTQNELEAAPYNWLFIPLGSGSDVSYGGGAYGDGLYGFGVGGTSYVARRRQAGAMVEQVGTDIAEVVSRVNYFESEIAAHNMNVNHDQTEFFGNTVRLVSE